MIVANPIKNSTVNLASPFIFNFDKKIMGQVIPKNADKYSLTEPLSKYMEK